MGLGPLVSCDCSFKVLRRRLENYSFWWQGQDLARLFLFAFTPSSRKKHICTCFMFLSLGKHTRDFTVHFWKLFWHHYIIDNGRGPEFQNLLMLNLKFSYAIGLLQYCVDDKKAMFYSAFLAKTFSLTSHICQKSKIPLLLWILWILPKAHSSTMRFCR
jgi:hypothetical protein